MGHIKQQLFELKSRFVNRTAQLQRITYTDGNLAVKVVAPIFGKIKQSELIAIISVNHENSCNLPDNQFYAKNYSENEGMLDCIEEAGLIKRISNGVQLGFVHLPIYELVK